MSRPPPDDEPVPTPVDVADEDLARQACRGVASALDRLVRRHTRGVFGLLARLLDDRALADDLTQEVFLRMVRSLETFDPSRRFRAWLHTIAWNLARDELRRRKRRGPALHLGGSDPDSDGRNAGIEPVDERGPDPQDRASALEERALVRRALSSLPPRQRGLLELRELEGFSYEEIAEISGCELGTIKSRLFRARGQLRDALKHLSPALFEARASARTRLASCETRAADDASEARQR